jgi:hypothetical protein
VHILAIFALFFEHGDQQAWLVDLFNRTRKEYPGFEEHYFEFLESLLNSNIEVDQAVDEKMIQILDSSIKDELAKYYQLIEIVHTRGYVHDDTIDAVRNFYDQHEGLSTVNECLRRAILSHFKRLMLNLPVESYPDYFELNKTFALYMQLFNNQQFNQEVKKLSMSYVQKLQKHYTDKRGKDYQDIKKFVAHTFVEMNFMTDKQIVELFKTRRRKKATA